MRCGAVDPKRKMQLFIITTTQFQQHSRQINHNDDTCLESFENVTIYFKSLRLTNDNIVGSMSFFFYLRTLSDGSPLLKLEVAKYSRSCFLLILSFSSLSFSKTTTFFFNRFVVFFSSVYPFLYLQQRSLQYRLRRERTPPTKNFIPPSLRLVPAQQLILPSGGTAYLRSAVFLTIQPTCSIYSFSTSNEQEQGREGRKRLRQKKKKKKVERETFWICAKSHSVGGI